MPAVSADIICRAMVDPTTAIEIARQMTAGVGNGNADILCAAGLNATPAIELARQINAAVFDANLLCAAMWNPITAVAIKVASGL